MATIEQRTNDDGSVSYRVKIRGEAGEILRALAREAAASNESV